LKHNKLIVDGAKTWDVKNAVHVARIYYETLPSFFGDERPASHELSRCSWLGAAKPVAWLRSKPPIMAKLQKLSRAKLSQAPATLSYSSGLQLSFLSIFGNWSCDHCPNIPLDGP
jgi:hypothetical protein